MRKIERQMIDAVADNIELWRKDNTKVVTDGDHTYVYLHGHMIADIDMETDTMLISTCGWQTSTTKSRLNALLGDLTPGRAGISQKNFCLSTRNIMPLSLMMTVSVQWLTENITKRPHKSTKGEAISSLA